MEKFKRFFTSKIVIFSIQILTLSLFIYLFDYKFEINFDKDISRERMNIIQFVANYVMYYFEKNNLTHFYFIYLSWMVVSLIPIFIFNDYKKAYSMNLTTFFFPNFFFYVFLYRYSPNYFNSHYITLLMSTFILGFFIIIFSIGVSILLNKTIRHKDKAQFEDFKKILEKIKFKCPYCGTEFNSIPQYCYNCLKELEEEDSINE